MLLPYFPREFPCLSAWVSPYEYSCVASFVSGIWTLQCLPRAFPCESGHALPSAFPSILVSPWVPWTVPSCALRALPCSFNLNPYPNSNFIYKPNLPRSLMSSRWVRSYVPRAFTVGSLMGLVVSYTTQSLVRFFSFYVGDFLQITTEICSQFTTFIFLAITTVRYSLFNMGFFLQTSP